MSGERLSKARIVAKAIEVADREGVDAVTLTRIANEFGVSQPALYRHVDGIEDLWRALAIMARDVLVERLSTAAIGKSGDDAVRAVADAWRRSVLEHPGLLTVPNSIQNAHDPELEASVDRVVNVLYLALASYKLDDENAVHAARSLRSALHGFTSLERASSHPSGADIDESFAKLVTLLCAGIHEMANSQVRWPAPASKRSASARSASVARPSGEPAQKANSPKKTRSAKATTASKPPKTAARSKR